MHTAVRSAHLTETNHDKSEQQRAAPVSHALQVGLVAGVQEGVNLAQVVGARVRVQQLAVNLGLLHLLAHLQEKKSARMQPTSRCTQHVLDGVQLA
jgi:hypothetical protein